MHPEKLFEVHDYTRRLQVSVQRPHMVIAVVLCLIVVEMQVEKGARGYNKRDLQGGSTSDAV